MMTPCLVSCEVSQLSIGLHLTSRPHLLESPIEWDQVLERLPTVLQPL
jgi:hypothetical protein